MSKTISILKSGNAAVQSNPIGALKSLLFIALAIIILLALFKFLRSAGLLGQTKEEKQAEQLGEIPAMQDLPNNPLVALLKQYTGKSVITNADILKQTPNRAKYGNWILAIKYAKGTFNDDEEAVFNVFKSLASQFEVSNFATLFKASQNKDLYIYLREFLDSEEMAFIYKMISQKPKFIK